MNSAISWLYFLIGCNVFLIIMNGYLFFKVHKTYRILATILVNSLPKK